MHQVLIVGAGLTGAVIARELAEKGVYCEVIDARSHIGGNCYTERDCDTGVMVHRYGPHIFHTANMEVWGWIRRFGEFRPYAHHVYANAKGRIYSLPINLHTLNQFFGTTMSPAEAEAFVSRDLAETIFVDRELNFEEQAISLVGRELYEAFFKGYTEKQWGMDATDVPGSILKRLPLRFNYDGTYFNHPVQAMPVNGYTEIVENILDHENINVSLDTSFCRSDGSSYDHTFYSGQLDRYFEFCEGRLPYRTLDFEVIRAKGDFQGCPVLNACDAEVPWTRTTEHKHFAPWEQHESTICYREFSRNCRENDIPYYPVNLAGENSLLDRYQSMANDLPNVSFVGRLGAFKYMDMDTAIDEALSASKKYLAQQHF